MGLLRRRNAAAVLISTALLVAPAVAAQAVVPVSVNRVDIAFVKGNGQTNLAEIAIGKIALERSGNPLVRALARQTMSDHYKAEARLKVVGYEVGVALPGRPSAAQRRQAAHLMTVVASQFDVTYLRDQVAGHELSLASTRQEFRADNRGPVHRYAVYYYPVAAMHLRMTEHALHSLA